MRLVVLFWVLTGGVCPALAQRTPPKAQRAPDVRVMVGDVNDKRTTGHFAECEVQLKIIGDAVADSLGVRAIRVRSAVDDTGRELKKDKEESSSESVSEKQGDSVEKNVTLRNPARRATAIRSIEGEIELYQPTAANGGLVVEKKFMARPNQPLPSPALKKWNVEVTYFTKEGFEAKKKEFEQQQERGGEAAAEKFGKALAEAFGSIFGSLAEDDENSLRFVIGDPDNRITDFAFRDGKGEPISIQGRYRSGPLMTCSLEGGLPPADAQLVIYLATPDAIKTVPFKVENIPLP
jgi:hypothetical protein